MTLRHGQILMPPAMTKFVGNPPKKGPVGIQHQSQQKKGKWFAIDTNSNIVVYLCNNILMQQSNEMLQFV